MDLAEIDDRFTHYPISAGKLNRQDVLRESFRKLAHEVNDMMPDGREKELSIQMLESALFYSDAAIARDYTREPNFRRP